MAYKTINNVDCKNKRVLVRVDLNVPMKGSVVSDSTRLKRIKKNNLKEVIIATSATVEGQTTAYYIQDSLKKTKTKVTALKVRI